MGEPAKAEFKGHPPTVKIEGQKKVAEVRITPEQAIKAMGITEQAELYMKAWSVPEYRNFSPGEQCVNLFLEAFPDVVQSSWKRPYSLVDWGCGTGRASAILLDHGFDVTMVDFAPNCLDADIAEHLSDRFVHHDITKKIKLKSEFGYCCDVMEHLPPDEIDDALEVILENSENVFFQISTRPDHFGQHPDIAHPLHLTVRPYSWWLKKFAEHGVIVHRSMEKDGAVIFFVTGYTGFAMDKMTPNLSLEEVHEHIALNAAHGFPGILAYEEQPDVEVVVLAGGPSLDENDPDLLKYVMRKQNGSKPVHFVTMNGSYRWLKEHFPGIPATQFMIDGRVFNKRFIAPVWDDDNADIDKFIIATQCHPQVFEELARAGATAYTWQVNISDQTIPVIEEAYGEMYKDWFPCPGGSTVMLRILPQLQQMGFRKLHIFGFDSCVMGEEHHAYEQRENDVGDASIIELKQHDRTFRLQPWMLAQTKEFFDMKDTILRHLNMTVYGEGLIAYLMDHGIESV